MTQDQAPRRGVAQRRRGLAPDRTHDLIGSREHPHAARLVARRSSHWLDDVVLHRTEDLLDVETMELGVLVTTPARTLVDMGLQVTDKELREGPAPSGPHGSASPFEEVWRIYRRISAQSQRGGTDRRSPAIDRHRLRRWPRAIWRSSLIAALEDVRGPDTGPPCQHDVIVDGTRFRLDLAYPDHRAFLRATGSGSTATVRASRIKRRQDLLVVHGWWLRFMVSDPSIA